MQRSDKAKTVGSSPTIPTSGGDALQKVPDQHKTGPCVFGNSTCKAKKVVTRVRLAQLGEHLPTQAKGRRFKPVSVHYLSGCRPVW